MAGQTTVGDLLKDTDLPVVSWAVAVNEQVVPRETADYELNEGTA